MGDPALTPETLAYKIPAPSIWTRRAALAALTLWSGASFGAAAMAQDTAPAILAVSRKRLLNETEAARALLKAEITLTSELQGEVDAVKLELNAEEEELARLRSTLERAVFEARVGIFDRRVRAERRRAQLRAAALQSGFRDARLKLVAALDPVLDAVRAAHGAKVIVNSDDILSVDPSIDVTAEVIAQVNATVPMPEIPEFRAFEPPSEVLDEAK